VIVDSGAEREMETQFENVVSFPHQLLYYADDVNLLGDDIDTIKKNTNFN
jgi:hypothetical protein